MVITSPQTRYLWHEVLNVSRNDLLECCSCEITSSIRQESSMLESWSRLCEPRHHNLRRQSNHPLLRLRFSNLSFQPSQAQLHGFITLASVELNVSSNILETS